MQTNKYYHFLPSSVFCFLLFAFCLLFSTITSKAQTTTSDMHLQGNISKLSVYKHVATNIVIENNMVISYEKGRLMHQVEYIFDKEGLLLAENKFDNRGVIAMSYIYEYDAFGRLIDKTIAKAGKYLEERTEYQYDKDGKKIKEIVYNDKDSLKTTTIYKYDSLGNLISEKLYNLSNRLVKDIYYQHDAKGNIIFINSVKVPLIFKPLPYQAIQKFNSNNKLIYKSYTEQDTLKWEYFATYNKKDSLTYEEVKDANEKRLSCSQLTFNKKNQRIVLKQYHQLTGEIGMETYYQYDKKGKLFVEKVCASNKKEPLIIRTYYYDEKNNWIYCVEEDMVKNENIIYYRRIIYR